MKLIDIEYNKKTRKFKLLKIKLYGGTLTHPYPTPKIILTEKEARERGLDIEKHKKGFYIKVDGIRVPINIEKNKKS